MARNSNVVVSIVFNRLPEIVRQLPREADEIIGETLQEMDATVQVGMAAGGTGRTYTRGGRTHTASAPGEMPARDTGALAGSMQQEIVRGRGIGYYYTNNEYAAHLEYGTVRMAARPFMTPAAERARGAFVRKLRNLERRLR